MSGAQLGSRSDLAALRRSSRGKIWALLAIAAVSAGAAAFQIMRPQGVGNPEDPARVMLVARARPHGAAITLRELGFDAIEATADVWQRKAEEEIPDLKEEGPAAALRLADLFGYGFVAFEDPQGVDWTGLETDPATVEVPPEATYVVVSAGDFAFPHRVTFPPPPSGAIVDPHVPLLQALFAQAPLAAALPENRDPTVADIELRDRLRGALDRLERVSFLERRVRDAETKLLEELAPATPAPGDPRLLLPPDQTGTPIPLSTGAVLVPARSFRLVSDGALGVAVDLADEQVPLLATPREDGPPGDPIRCDAPFGGPIALRERPRWFPAADGRSLVLHTVGEGSVLYRVDSTEASPSGCPLRRAGRVLPPSPGEQLGSTVPYGDRVVRHGRVGEVGMVSVVQAEGTARELLAMQPGFEVVKTIWIDERRLAAVLRPWAEELEAVDWIVLLDREHPLVVFSMDARVFDGVRHVTDLAVVPASPGQAARTLAVIAGDAQQRLYLVEGDAPLAARFDPAPTLGRKEGASGMPVVFPLDSNEFTVRPIFLEEDADSLRVAPDGGALALRLWRLDGPGEPMVGWIGLGRRARQALLTTGDFASDHLGFTADGRAVVFRSHVPVPTTRLSLRLPRFAWAPPPR